MSLMGIHHEPMPNPDTSLPLFALDFETTGLNARFDRVLEAGLAGPRPFHALVSDAGPSSPGALATHGITEGEAQRAGLPGVEAFLGMLEALGAGPVRIASHNAAFERGFMEAWAGRLGQALPEIEWVCTLDFARGLCPDPSISKNLEALARRLGLRHGALHRAMADAALTLRLHPVLQAWETIRAELGQTDALIYLAGPLRGDGSHDCIRHNQIQMMLQAQWTQGVLPQATLCVPHCNFAFLDESRDPAGRVRELALRGCEKLLARSDSLILCGDVLSPGMMREREVALQMGIPIFQVPGWDAFLVDPGDQADGAA
jgi:DNA polymerase III epsilon subunit-like protein